MKNNDIVQMLLDDGESTAVPNLSKENARSLALRHGNCVEKKSKSLLENNRYSYTDIKQGQQQPIDCGSANSGGGDVSGGLKIKSLVQGDEKESYCTENKSFRFSLESYETLIDSILSCQTYYSIMIGIFMKYAHYFKNQNIVLIKEIFTKKIDNLNIRDTRLKISLFLVTVILLSSFIFGYLSGLIISWEVGLSVGFTILFVLLIGIALILIGSYSQSWKMALDAGVIVTNSLESLKLLLNVLFMNPRPENKIDSNNISIIYTHLVVSNYSNNYHAVAKFIENIWTSIEKNYTNFLIRYLKASLNKDHGERKFKRICCLPTFVYFIVSTICILSLGTLFKIHEGNVRIIFINKLSLIAFSFLSIVLIITQLGLSYLMMKMICCILHSPAHNLKGFLKSYNIYGEASTQAFLISEFNSVMDFLAQIDNYKSNRQSCIISFIDATGAVDLKILTEFCHFCQILLKNRNEIPICMILFADNKLYSIVDSCEGMNDFFAFSRCLSLSLYLEDATGVIGIDNNTGDMNQSLTNQAFIQNGTVNENIRYIGINKQSNDYRSDIIIQKFYRNNATDQKDDILVDGLNVKHISDFLIIKSKLSDFNVPCIKDLVLISTYAYKVSKIQTVTTDLFKLIDLVTLFYHWPFLYAWISLFIDTNSITLKRSLTIKKLYDTFLRNMLQALVEEPVILELSKNDLNYTIIENIIDQTEIGDLTIDEFMILNAACHLQNIPMQSFIKGTLKRAGNDKTRTLDPFYDGISDKTTSSKNRYFPLQSQTLKSDLTGAELTIEKSGKMTPKSFKRCIQSIKDIFSSFILSEMSLDDVIWMVGQIKEISSDNIEKYQERIKEINLNGLVLATCDIYELRNELQMTFGDWHLFKTLINYLKSIEETSECAIFQDVTDNNNNNNNNNNNINKPSPFNPLTLLTKSEIISDTANNEEPVEQYDSNSNDLILSDDTQCKICENRINSDTDSVWKRKASPYGVNMCKDHFLSPVSVSSISSPKLQYDTTGSRDNKLNNKTDMSNFYSVKESEINEDQDILKQQQQQQQAVFPVRTKSLPREASFESTTTFSTQLSSPRNSKCFYDIENNTKVASYSLPNDRKKRSIAHNNKVKPSNHVYQSYNPIQQAPVTISPQQLDLEAIDVPVPPTGASKFQSYLRKNDQSHSSCCNIDDLQQYPSLQHQQQHQQQQQQQQQQLESKKSHSQSNVVRGNSVKIKRYASKADRNKKSSNNCAVQQQQQQQHFPNTPADYSKYYSNMEYFEPDIIFRSKSYTNGHEFHVSKSLKNKNEQHYRYKAGSIGSATHNDKTNSNGQNKERKKDRKERHKNSYAEALNNEISHSEI